MTRGIVVIRKADVKLNPSGLGLGLNWNCLLSIWDSWYDLEVKVSGDTISINLSIGFLLELVGWNCIGGVLGNTDDLLYENSSESIKLKLREATSINNSTKDIFIFTWTWYRDFLEL